RTSHSRRLAIRKASGRRSSLRLCSSAKEETASAPRPASNHRIRGHARPLVASKGHMNTSRRVATFVCLVSFVLLTPSLLSAQIYESIGTRAQGMGGAFVAVADDASTTWWNPAGLILTYFSAVLEQSETDLPADAPPGGPASRTQPRSFAVAFPALGLSYYRMRISEIAPPISTETAQAVRQDL